MKKLIRDFIPEKIEDKSLLSQVSDAEYRKALINKLKEEVQELNVELKTPHTERIMEEMADVLEVLSCITKEFGVDSEELFKVADAKRKEKGSFLSGSMLTVNNIPKRK